MPGRRMIVENICIDKRLNKVSEGSENLFYRLLTKADDGAIVFADTDLIKQQVYPRRQDVTEEEIEKRLQELHNARDEYGLGLIVLYVKSGERYAYLPKFFKHQTLRKDIKPKYLYPAITKEDLERIRNGAARKVSNKEVNKEVSKDEVKTFKTLYRDPEKLRLHLVARDVGPEKIEDILNKVFDLKKGKK